MRQLSSEPSLFDPPPVEVNLALANKIESYHSRSTQLKRGTQKEQVFQALCRLRVASHADLAEATRIPRHLIPDRVLSLIKLGLVAECNHKKTDPNTNKTVTLYKPLVGN